MMLWSYLNMKLRDEYESLDELCLSLDLAKEDVLSRMEAIGMTYDPEGNRFC